MQTARVFGVKPAVAGRVSLGTLPDAMPTWACLLGPNPATCGAGSPAMGVGVLLRARLPDFAEGLASG